MPNVIVIHYGFVEMGSALCTIQTQPLNNLFITLSSYNYLGTSKVVTKVFAYRESKNYLIQDVDLKTIVSGA